MTKWLHIIFVLPFLAVSLSAQVVQDNVPELEQIDVEEQLGGIVPLDLTFTDESGQTVRLGDYFNGGTPVIIILGYYECPMLCNLIFNGVTAAIPEVGLEVGKDYRIVTVSINPSETPQLAAAKKKNYMEALQIPGAESGWHFLVGQEDQSRALADAIGFEYYWDEKNEQYAHPAVLTLVAEDGKITRYLYGIQFDPKNLKLALLETSEGKIGNTIDKLILYCYHYDPDSEGYVIVAGNIMRLGGAATLVLLAAFIGGLWLRERKRRLGQSLSMNRSN